MFPRICVLFPKATVTKYQKLDGLNNRNVWPPSMDARSPKLRSWKN